MIAILIFTIAAGCALPIQTAMNSRLRAGFSQSDDARAVPNGDGRELMPVTGSSAEDGAITADGASAPGESMPSGGAFPSGPSAPSDRAVPRGDGASRLLSGGPPPPDGRACRPQSALPLSPSSWAR
ncbi:hypothetical protein DDD63_04905 [Actinobaculum sp. 313]|nr:hypothetical protein DDD63_04905 [Actinobaculum sp. 313]